MDQTEIRRAVGDAVREGQSLRATFYKTLGEPDKQAFGKPASASEIERIETLIGASLPPSFRAFLELFNGWKMFDPAVDLYSAKEILEKASSTKLKSWRQVAFEVEGVNAGNWLLVGGSEFAAAKYFLDPNTLTPDGEMFAIDHDKTVEAEHESFLKLLLVSNDDYRSGNEDLDAGFDFTNI